MKRTVNLIGISLVCALLLASQIQAQKEEPKTVDELLRSLNARSTRIGWGPFAMWTEPLSLPKGSGMVSLRLFISPNVICDEVEITIDNIDNLEYLGALNWRFPCIPEDTNTYDLTLNIPAHDTSGLRITAKCGKWTRSIPAYFTTAPDTALYYFSDPRDAYPSSKYKSPKKRIGIPDSLFHKELEMAGPPKRWQGKTDEDGKLWPVDSIVDGYTPNGRRIGSFDEDGNFIWEDSVDKVIEEYLLSKALADSVGPSIGPRDYNKLWVVDKDGNRRQVDRQTYTDSVNAQKGQARLEKMRRVEETPLTEARKQYFDLNGIMMVRHKGEYKFREAVTTTDPHGYSAKYRDSLRMSQGKIFDCIFDLSDPADFDLAKGLIDSLLPTDSAGVYRAVVEWNTLLQLRDAGITFHKSGWKPRESRGETDPDNSSKKKNDNHIAPQ